MAGSASLAEIDFSRLDRAVVGISGGSDSTALLVLLREAIARSGANTEILAVTVDHGLRQEAAGEAQEVAEFCASAGIAHKTIKWERAVPLRSGFASTARSARYRLLSKAAEEFDAGVIFAGHTLDDQIETVEMRLARGSGRGLAGIAPLALYDRHIWIARPLLGARRAELRSILALRETGWIEDPSNLDGRNERARVRKTLAGKPATYLQRLLKMREEAEARRIAAAGAAATFVSAHASLAAPGLVEMDAGAFLERTEGTTTAMRALIAVMGGKTHFPDFPRIGDLLRALERGNGRRSLGGCVIERFGGSIFMWREFRGAGPRPVEAASGTVWDRRWRLMSEADATGTVVSALGRDGKLPPGRLENPPPRRIRRAASAALPVLVRDKVRVEDEAAEFNPADFAPAPAPWQEFLPVFDLALATAVEKLLCGAGLPGIPAALEKLFPA